MRCPKCGTESSVLETRAVKGNLARRRRACDDITCNTKFTTVETIVPTNTKHNDAVVLVLPRHVVRELRRLTTIVLTELPDDPAPPEPEPGVE